MSEDIFVATTRPEDAVVGPLHTVTMVTREKDPISRIFEQGMELESTAWQAPSGEDLDRLNRYFGLPPASEWEACAFYRDGDAGNVQIRVMVFRDETPIVRPAIDGRYVGGLSIGFPMSDMTGRETRMAELGVTSSIGVKELEFASPTGEVYVSGEIHFLAPENVFLLGVQRPAVFVPVGPMDAERGIGAAAYSARCVSNTDEVIRFFEDALGFETRRDITMAVGERSGLRLEEGLAERFVQMFSPGSSTGYLVFLDHESATKPSPAASLGPPSRGVVMWSFPTAQLDAVYDKLQQSNLEIVHPPGKLRSPFLPNTRSMLVKDPGGFPIELFEV